MIHTISVSASRANLADFIALVVSYGGNEKTELLSITVFALPWAETYKDHIFDIRRELSKYFEKEDIPLITYVAQEPLPSSHSSFSAELHFVGPDVKRTVKEGKCGSRYVKIGDSRSAIIISEGVCGKEAWENAKEILSTNDIEASDIVRQWNYIGDITKYSAEGQHYQIFNDDRSEFYKGVQWAKGYPAATGIGCMGKGYMLSFIAAKQGEGIDIKPIDNPNQVAAHSYSAKVLEGSEALTTPKFERAKTLRVDNKILCFVSGTAAINGEISVDLSDVERQTRLTIEHLNTLLEEAAKVEKVDNKFRYTSLRAYIKNAIDVDVVRSVVEEFYPHTHCLYLLGDVCREELLVEIEGIAQMEF